MPMDVYISCSYYSGRVGCYKKAHSRSGSKKNPQLAIWNCVLFPGSVQADAGDTPWGCTSRWVPGGCDRGVSLPAGPARFPPCGKSGWSSHGPGPADPQLGKRKAQWEQHPRCGYRLQHCRTCNTSLCRLHAVLTLPVSFPMMCVLCCCFMVSLLTCFKPLVKATFLREVVLIPISEMW